MANVFGVVVVAFLIGVCFLIPSLACMFFRDGNFLFFLNRKYWLVCMGGVLPWLVAIPFTVVIAKKMSSGDGVAVTAVGSMLAACAAWLVFSVLAVLRQADESYLGVYGSLRPSLMTAAAIYGLVFVLEYWDRLFK